MSPENVKEFTEAFFEFFSAVERKMVKRLNKHFEEDGAKMFKSIRLPMPLTQQTIHWDINMQNINQTLRSETDR